MLIAYSPAQKSFFKWCLRGSGFPPSRYFKISLYESAILSLYFSWFSFLQELYSLKAVLVKLIVFISASLQMIHLPNHHYSTHSETNFFRFSLGGKAKKYHLLPFDRYKQLLFPNVFLNLCKILIQFLTWNMIGSGQEISFGFFKGKSKSVYTFI